MGNVARRHLAVGFAHAAAAEPRAGRAQGFVAQELPACYDRVEGFSRRQGAYARFKDLLEHEGALERWSAFEADAVESPMRQWCAEDGLELVQT